MEDPPDTRIGSVLQGRYRILLRLSEGGMGVVYKGERLGLGRPVAIKFLHAEYAKQGAARKRFENEARAMSRLGHPHCVSVIDFGVEDGAPYVVMDYVRGTTLRDLLDAGPIPLPRAIHIGRQLLAALAHAHGQGIIHRDVKPANVMLSEATGTGDHARVLDFGLAKLRDGGAPGESTASLAIGTPAYMAPEQTLGGEVDGRADLYAAGVLVFELLTGNKPYEADQAFEVLAMHREAPIPRLRDRLPSAGFTEALEDVVVKALAKAPADRFQTAAEFLAALDATPEGQRRAVTYVEDVARADTIAARAASSTPPERAASLPPPPRVATPPPRVPTPAPAPHAATAPPRPDSESSVGPPPPPLVRPAYMLALLLAGAGVAAWWLWLRGSPEPGGGRPPRASAPVQAPATTPGLAPGPPQLVDAAPVAALPIDAAPLAALPVDAGALAALAPDAGLLALAPGGDAGPAFPPDEQPEPIPAIEIDPPSDEAVDPPTQQPPAPAVEDRPVESVKDAEKLIAAGEKDKALRGLERLQRKSPKSAYVPYLLGNLYFERMWWSDGIQAYRQAIKNNRDYRKRAILNRNVIRALSSGKTYAKASSLIQKDIGKAALPYLRKAAKSDHNPTVRKRAAALVKKLD